MRLLFLGAPGSGKGTQSERLRNRLGIPQLSTGEMLRQTVAGGGELGQRVRVFLDQGALVPDELITCLVRARIIQPDCKAGYILDGFPRTAAQAVALDEVLRLVKSHLDAVCEIVVPEDVLLVRLAGRWLCKQCGASYHVEFRPPRQAGLCDACGGALYQRLDDTLNTAHKRLRIYREETLPLVKYYRKQGVVKVIDGVGSADEIEARITSAIGK